MSKPPPKGPRALLNSHIVPSAPRAIATGTPPSSAGANGKVNGTPNGVAPLPNGYPSTTSGVPRGPRSMYSTVGSPPTPTRNGISTMASAPMGTMLGASPTTNATGLPSPTTNAVNHKGGWTGLKDMNSPRIPTAPAALASSSAHPGSPANAVPPPLPFFVSSPSPPPPPPTSIPTGPRNFTISLPKLNGAKPTLKKQPLPPSAIQVKPPSPSPPPPELPPPPPEDDQPVDEDAPPPPPPSNANILLPWPPPPRDQAKQRNWRTSSSGTIRWEGKQYEDDIPVADPRTVRAPRKREIEFKLLTYEDDETSTMPKKSAISGVTFASVSTFLASDQIWHYLFEKYGSITNYKFPRDEQYQGFGVVWVLFADKDASVSCLKEDGKFWKAAGLTLNSVRPNGKETPLYAFVDPVGKGCDLCVETIKRHRLKAQAAAAMPQAPSSAFDARSSSSSTSGSTTVSSTSNATASTSATSVASPSKISTPIRNTPLHRPSSSTSMTPVASSSGSQIKVHSPLPAVFDASAPIIPLSAPPSTSSLPTFPFLPAKPPTPIPVAAEAPAQLVKARQAVSGKAKGVSRFKNFDVDRVGRSRTPSKEREEEKEKEKLKAKQKENERENDRHWSPSGNAHRSRTRSRSRSRGRRDRHHRSRSRSPGLEDPRSYRPRRTWSRGRSRSRSRSRGRRKSSVDSCRSTTYHRDAQRSHSRSQTRSRGRSRRHRPYARSRSRTPPPPHSSSKNELDRILSKTTTPYLLLPRSADEKWLDELEVHEKLLTPDGWIFTFKNSDGAKRAQRVIRMKHQVEGEIKTFKPEGKKTWTQDSLISKAREMILREAEILLSRDIRDRVLSKHIRDIGIDSSAADRVEDEAGNETGRSKKLDGLKGLSFRKKRIREAEPESEQDRKRQKVVEEPQVVVVAAEETVVMPEKKKRKTRDADTSLSAKRPKRIELKVDEIEEEEEEERPSISFTPTPTPTPGAQVVEESPFTSPNISRPASRLGSVDVEIVDEMDIDELERELVKAAEAAKPRKKKTKQVNKPKPVPKVKTKPPKTTKKRATATLPSPSPSPPPEKAFDFTTLGLSATAGEDWDEDVYYLKLALSTTQEAQHMLASLSLPTPSPEPDYLEPRPYRVHITGSARTEGYYKIPHEAKGAYVAQYSGASTREGANARAERAAVEAKGSTAGASGEAESKVSSRSARANNRRLAQGMEEINQLNLALSISKGLDPTGPQDAAFKFNQLHTRHKSLKFDRSPIHSWGLYALERIPRGDMVIEYIGEVIRSQVAEKREKAYERQGIGSSYLFRIDDDHIVDATMRGNLGRLINHSCDPNCTAKIITINGVKKIVIYAKMDIQLGDEITYDYHFPLEQEKIPCLCGSTKCRGFLN